MWKKNFKPRLVVGSSETTCVSRVTDGKKIKFKRLRADVAYPSAGNPENFTLKAQIDAGVELREENSMLLPPSQKEVNEHLGNFIADYDKEKEKEKVNENE